MSVLAPVGDPRYSQLRPNLALAPGAGTPFAEDESLQWHPAAAALATLHGEGKVSAFPAVGYDHPDQSHFTSRHYYEIGELEVGFRTGWLGRYIDLVGDDDNPLQGLSMDGSLSPMIATAERPVAAIDSVDGYDLWSRVSDPVSNEMFKSFARFGSLPADSPGLAQVRRATAQTDKLRQDLGGIGEFSSPVTYPDDWFSHRLAGLAAFIAAGLPMRVVTIRAAGGYDTHAGQAEDLERNLRQTCEGLLAFQRDLEARGLADRVLIEIWSEFGRRPEENGSAGHRPRRGGLRLRDRIQGEGRDGRRIPRPRQSRRQRQPARHQRLPGDVLLAARAVAGTGRRGDHPRGLGVRPADPGEGVTRAGAAILAVALLAAAMLARETRPLAGAPAARAATGCNWTRHAKRVVKHVRRHGRVRRVKRTKHWWTCNPKPAAPSDGTPPAASVPTTPPQEEPPPDIGHLGVRAVEWSYTLSAPKWRRAMWRSSSTTWEKTPTT